MTFIMSIRFRLFLLLCLMSAKALGLGFFSWKTFNDFKNSRRHLDISYQIRDAISSPDLRYNSQAVQNLQALSTKLTPPRRQREFNDLMKDLSEGRFPRDRQDVFLKNEAEFQRYTREHLNYLEERLLYFGGMALLTLAFGFFILQVFLSRAIIGPLQDLSRKMVDFLNDRYTYQFSVPGLDEIGKMQSTFNSLAQRVIHNMEQLRTLDSAKSEFLSIASHELRTPLTSIKGSLGLMRSGVVGQMNEMAENLLTIAESETDRLIRLINDLLDLAKIEARKLPLKLDWRSVNDLITRTTQSLQGLAQQANVKLKAEVSEHLEAHMDSDRIHQVLTNLLSNAIKYSPAQSTVIVRCTVNGENSLLIEVKDSGRGIDPNDQQAIFEKFRQATSAKNPLVKGTGLGLAIAKALVEEHGGQIGVKSLPGQGSTFYFTLPEWRFAKAPKLEASA